jgi:hypothetical protein
MMFVSRTDWSSRTEVAGEPQEEHDKQNSHRHPSPTCEPVSQISSSEYDPYRGVVQFLSRSLLTRSWLHARAYT